MRPMRNALMNRLGCVLLVLGAGCSKAAPKSAPTSGVPAPPIERVYRIVDGVPLKAFVFKPTGAARGTRAPAILLFHGGGWVAGSPDWTFASAERYAALGLVAVSVQYRLSTGGITPREALEDVCDAFSWTRAHAESLAIDPRRIAASGVSAGGHLAAAAATIGCGSADGAYGTGGPDALVLWSPALDVSNDGHFRRLLGERVHVYPGVGHLLTRNLANQESDFDPDPVARADGNAKQVEFLRDLWLR